MKGMNCVREVMLRCDVSVYDFFNAHNYNNVTQLCTELVPLMFCPASSGTKTFRIKQQQCLLIVSVCMCVRESE